MLGQRQIVKRATFSRILGKKRKRQHIPPDHPLILSAKKNQTKILSAFVTLIETVKRSIDMKALSAALLYKDWGRVMELVNVKDKMVQVSQGHGLAHNVTSFRDALRRTYYDGAKIGVAQLDRVKIRKDYNPDEPRDEHGRWTGGGGSETSSTVRDFRGSLSAADIFQSELNSKWATKLTQEEMNTVGRYTDDTYAPINDTLRGNRLGMAASWEKVYPDIPKWTQLLDAAIQKADPLDEPVAVYRGFGAGKGAEKLLALTRGDRITDFGFTSTSLSPFEAAVTFSGSFEGVRPIAQIILPAGAKAAPIDGSSLQENEREMLLPRGSSFKMTGVERGVELVSSIGVKTVSDIYKFEYVPPSLGKSLLSGISKSRADYWNWNDEDLIFHSKVHKAVGDEEDLTAVEEIPSVAEAMSFDELNPATLDFLNSYEMSLITNVSVDTQAAIHDIVVEAFQLGGHPSQQAREIRDLIGLTPQLEIAVDNYRTMLENGDHTTALTRALRDRRFDPTLENNAILDQDQIDNQVDRYALRALAYRANSIARTESLRASNEGQKGAWNQAVQQGFLDAENTIQVVLLGPDPCPICEEIAATNEDGVGMDEAFETPDNVDSDYPPFHPNCMCSVGLRLLSGPIFVDEEEE